MRQDLNQIVALLPDTITIPEIISRVNKANGLTVRHHPRAHNTHSWLEIYRTLRAAGYHSTYIIQRVRDEMRCYKQVLTPVFSKFPKTIPSHNLLPSGA